MAEKVVTPDPTMNKVPGVVMPPEEPKPQLRKPLTPENMKDGDDARNVYNPDKQPNPWHNYTQSSNAKPENIQPTLSKVLPPTYNKQMNYGQTSKESFASNQIYPEHPTGLEPPPRQVTNQLRQPLILENPHNENSDFKNWYNPNKSNNPTAYT